MRVTSLPLLLLLSASTLPTTTLAQRRPPGGLELSYDSLEDSPDEVKLPGGPPPPPPPRGNSTSMSNSTDSMDYPSDASTEEEESEVNLDEDPSEEDSSKGDDADEGAEVTSKGLNQATTTIGGVMVKPKPSATGKGCNDDSRGPLECLNPKHCFECTCRCDTGVWSSNKDERFGHMVAATSDGVLGDAGQVFCAQNNRVFTLLQDGKVECANAIVDSKTGEFIDCQQKWGRCSG